MGRNARGPRQVRASARTGASPRTAHRLVAAPRLREPGAHPPTDGAAAAPPTRRRPRHRALRRPAPSPGHHRTHPRRTRLRAERPLPTRGPQTRSSRSHGLPEDWWRCGPRCRGRCARVDSWECAPPDTPLGSRPMRAASRHGVLTNQDLMAHGMGPAAVAHAVAGGELVRRARGLFVVAGSPDTRGTAGSGHRPSRSRGASSHQCASGWWGLPGFRTTPLQVVRLRPGSSKTATAAGPSASARAVAAPAPDTMAGRERDPTGTHPLRSGSGRTPWAGRAHLRHHVVTGPRQHRADGAERSSSCRAVGGPGSS